RQIAFFGFIIQIAGDWIDTTTPGGWSGAATGASATGCPKSRLSIFFFHDQLDILHAGSFLVLTGPDVIRSDDKVRPALRFHQADAFLLEYRRNFFPIDSDKSSFFSLSRWSESVEGMPGSS